MPASEKTPLGFNNWKAEDKPARADFCGDNTLLDSLLTNHFGDSGAHLTEADQEVLKGTYVGTYVGTGSGLNRIALPVAAKAVLVAHCAMAPCHAVGGVTEVHMGLASPNDSSMGVSLSGQTLLVRQTQIAPPEGGQKICMNENGSNYFYVAFR